MRERFADLINNRSGCFKRELVRSLGTKDAKEAKRRDHREALRAGSLFDEAAAVMVGGGDAPRSMTEVDLKELGAEVRAEPLAGDEGERDEGDDRRRLQTAEDRERWPDLEAPVPTVRDVSATTVPAVPARAKPDPAAQSMTDDHLRAYGDLLAELEGEFRDALARRDPSNCGPECRVGGASQGLETQRGGVGRLASE